MSVELTVEDYLAGKALLVHCPRCERAFYEKKKTVARERIREMAHDVSIRTYFDSSDHEQGKVPMLEYPEVEKAIVKWLTKFGVGVADK